MDTIRGVPALADTDAAALLGQYSRDLRTWLWGQAGPTPTPITYETGFSGSLTVTRWGRLIELSGTVNGSLPTTTNTVVATINDAAYRPQASITRIHAYWTAAATGLGYVVGANGQIGITNETALVRTSTQLFGVWLASP